MKILREHQSETVDAINSIDEGIVHLPTGTGKTFIQASSILSNLISNKVYVILSPRILLTNQLYSEVKEILINNKKDCQYLIVHSGKAEDKSDLSWCKELPFREVNNTTSSITIREDYERAMIANVPLIIFGTYDSAERIVQAGIPVEMLFCDEAHYLVSEEFNWIRDEKDDNMEKFFNAKRKYYFTATLKETASDNGLGMNNSNRFGPVIYTKSPAEMIVRGEIVRPRMHLVDVNIDDIEDEIDIDVNAILESFTEHKMHCKVAPKLLVVCKGSEHLNKIANHPKIKQLLESSPNLTLFDITSAYNPRINGVKVSRKEFLNRLQSLKDYEEAIILHVRILTEGIDVPGITGVMIMNNLKMSAFLQTLGRATRLHSRDRKRLYDGTMLSDELNRFTKPYAYIIIPIYGELGDDIKANFIEMITALRSFDFSPSEDIVIKQKRGKALPVSLENLNELDTIETTYKNAIYDVLHEVEETEKANELILENFKLEEKIKNESIDETITRLINIIK